MSPSTGGCQCGASSTCLTSDSSPSCIILMRVSGRSKHHTSLCANRLSASLRLRVQLRGDSLISHLAVLFLSCCVIMLEVDGLVRSGLYLKEDTDEHFWKHTLLRAVCTCRSSITTELCSVAKVYHMISQWLCNNLLPGRCFCNSRINVFYS